MEPTTRTGTRLWYYSYFTGHGHERLAEMLDTAEPFRLLPSQIVERLLAAGCKPDLDQASRAPFPTAGAIFMDRFEGNVFIVSIDTKDQVIVVQEQRMEPYGRGE